MEKENTSRRDFLKGAALAGASIVGSGALTSYASSAFGSPATEIPTGGAVGSAQAEGILTWLPPEPNITDADVEAEVTVDVIVIGCGVAGTVASRAAAEEGASVITIEKAAGPMCRSGDYAVVDGKTNARWGRVGVFDHDMLAEHELSEQAYFPKRAIYKKWADGCGEVFDWFIEALPELFICQDQFTDVPDENAGAYLYPSFYPLPEGADWTKERYPTYPTTVAFGPSQAPVLNANWQKAEATGATPYWGHFAEKLIMENGRVVGCYARNAETGKYLKATANKGVVLATGEYSSNREILAYYAPQVIANGIPAMWPERDVEGNPTNTGDGLKMGAYINAAIQQHHAPMIHYMGVGAVGTSPYLRLNVHGKRFMNEDVPGQQVQNQMEGQPGRRIFTFFDSAWSEQLQYFQPQHGSANYVVDELPQNLRSSGVVLRDAVDSAVESGRLIESDTIEGLLDQLDGINKEAAMASIQRYNELAKAGKDEDFGKPASRLFALENPPYYAAENGMSAMLVCCGGLVSDEDCHVYDNNGDIIPGIYVAGNIQGGRYAVAYPIAVRGISHSLCMFYGYTAGKNAVAQV